MTRRTVVKSMNWLEANEVLTVQRVVGQSSRCSINIEWLKANQCQDFTREADSHVKNIHTPCEADSHPPVSDLHTPCEADSHKGDQEGNQQKEVKKETKPARKTKRQTKAEAAKAEELRLREEVKAVPKPDGLPEGYAELFDLWIDVRKKYEAWTNTRVRPSAFTRRC